MICLNCLVGAAQKQPKQLGFTLGMSAFKSKSVNIFYEKQVRHRNYIGVFAESVYYYEKPFAPALSEAEVSTFSTVALSEVEVSTPFKHYYAGLYYKPLISASRNFSHYFLAGGAAGTFKKKFLYYPFVGLEQNFYISPVSQVFIREEVNYLFKSDRHWQPFLKAGMKFKLN